MIEAAQTAKGINFPKRRVDEKEIIHADTRSSRPASYGIAKSQLSMIRFKLSSKMKHHRTSRIVYIPLLNIRECSEHLRSLLIYVGK